jgi:hypothetical protein
MIIWRLAFKLLPTVWKHQVEFVSECTVMMCTSTLFLLGAHSIIRFWQIPLSVSHYVVLCYSLISWCYMICCLPSNAMFAYLVLCAMYADTVVAVVVVDDVFHSMYSDAYLPGATVAVHCVTYPLSWYVTHLLLSLPINLPLLLLAVVSWCVHYLFSGASCSEALYSSLLFVVVSSAFADICSSSFILNQLVEICDWWWLSSTQ